MSEANRIIRVLFTIDAVRFAHHILLWLCFHMEKALIQFVCQPVRMKPTVGADLRVCPLLGRIQRPTGVCAVPDPKAGGDKFGQSFASGSDFSQRQKPSTDRDPFPPHRIFDKYSAAPNY